MPKSGKTTVFNALTRGKAETAAYSVSGSTPNVGVAKVADPRLAVLAGMFHPQKVVPAEVKYVDIAAFPKGFGKGEGISGTLLNHLSRADELLYVVRAFKDDALPHVAGSVNPARDIVTLNTELAFSDLIIQERRLERMVSSLKGAKSPERERILAEQSLLERVKGSLENEVPVREQELTADEWKLVSNYQFLTAKPLLVLVNIGEDQLERAGELEAELRPLVKGPKCDVMVVCAKLEEELSRLSDDEANEFRKSMAAGPSALEKVTSKTYQLLGLISFLTVGPDEVRAWTIQSGTMAVHAAGKIHSDLERGFIRAEVIGYEDLVRCGGMAEARKHGLLRLEGKNYVVKDGDVVSVLFNV